MDCLFSYAEVERTAWVEAFAEGTMTTTTTAIRDESPLDSRKGRENSGDDFLSSRKEGRATTTVPHFEEGEENDSDVGQRFRTKRWLTFCSFVWILELRSTEDPSP